MTERTYVTEDALQAAVIREVKHRYPDAWVWHPIGHPFQQPGIPDLLMCIDGMFFGIELKNPGPSESIRHAFERTTPEQRRVIRNLNLSGAVAATATSVTQVLHLIEHREPASDLPLDPRWPIEEFIRLHLEPLEDLTE